MTFLSAPRKRRRASLLSPFLTLLDYPKKLHHLSCASLTWSRRALGETRRSAHQCWPYSCSPPFAQCLLLTVADCLRSFSSFLHGLSSTNWTSGSKCQSPDHYFLFSLHLLTGFASTSNSSVKILHASFPCCWHRDSVQDSCYTFGIGKLSSHKILWLCHLGVGTRELDLAVSMEIQTPTQVLGSCGRPCVGPSLCPTIGIMSGNPQRMMKKRLRSKTTSCVRT